MFLKEKMDSFHGLMFDEDIVDELRIVASWSGIDAYSEYAFDEFLRKHIKTYNIETFLLKEPETEDVKGISIVFNSTGMFSERYYQFEGEDDE